jgi:hypothetical protein
MAVTSTRKLLSYLVSFMLLYFCKYSYDHHQDQMRQTDSPFVVVKDGNSFSPEIATEPSPVPTSTPKP